MPFQRGITFSHFYCNNIKISAIMWDYRCFPYKQLCLNHTVWRESREVLGMNTRFGRLLEILGKSNMVTCWHSFLYEVIYRGDKARIKEEKEVCFTIYQFEILLCELSVLLLSSIHSITLHLIYIKLIAYTNYNIIKANISGKRKRTGAEYHSLTRIPITIIA